MEAASMQGRTLRATLCEIERGVFYATYLRGQLDPDTDDLPNYQTGASAFDAKQRIELRARAFGYDAVIWTESSTAPLFPAHAETAFRNRQRPTPHAPAYKYR